MQVIHARTMVCIQKKVYKSICSSQFCNTEIGEKQICADGSRMTNLNFKNLALFGTIFLFLHFGVKAESSSTCSLPGLPGRDGLPGQPGRDGRDGTSGPAGPPGGNYKLGAFFIAIVICLSV